MENMIKIFIFAIFILIALLFAYLLLVYIYKDRNPKKWRSILFSKNDSVKRHFYSTKGNKK